ncbi:DUF484 family protein [Dechloromonas sp. H13]|uniref:DUF484 family protein n=1 Tax=Dechloromonas sp. H13 TaxID=2570193 RepID=UPI001292A103|nr:DUF484 family protein [Dechloromonas sp. H13]
MSAPFAEDVAEYLKSNPGFFEQYADLLAQIYVPHPHGGRAVSLAERQMLTLREKNRETESKLAELIAFGEENDAISEKVHRLAVGLIAVETFPAAIHLMRFHLRDDFAVPHVTLRLWQKPAGIEELPEFAAVAPELQVFADTLAHPFCGSTSGFGTAAWFGEHAAHIRSQALIALCDGGATIGMLALGSEDAQRFYAEMGTLYLERMGEMLSAVLTRVAKPAP